MIEDFMITLVPGLCSVSGIKPPAQILNRPDFTFFSNYQSIFTLLTRLYFKSSYDIEILSLTNQTLR